MRAVSLTEDGLPFVEGPIKRYLIGLYVGHLRSKKASGNPDHYDDKDGILLTAEQQHYHIKAFWATQTEEALMNVIEALEGNYKVAETLWQSYEAKLKNFRAMVKNDIASLDASARGAREAVSRIKAVHDELLSTMNSAEMDKAIDNAERLASALERISGLRSHKLTLAVIDSLPSGNAKP